MDEPERAAREDGGPEPWDEGHIQSLGGALVAAANAARIGLSVVTFDGGAPRCVYITDVGAEILGHPREVILSRPAMAFLTPAEREVREGMRRQRLTDGGSPPSSFETSAVTSDGREVPIEVSLAQIQVGQRPVLVIFFQDISGRRRSVEALKRSEERFRRLIELAPDAVWINDGQRLVFTSPATARMLGYDTVEEVLALDPREFIHPDDVGPMQQRSRQMFTTGVALPPRDYRVRRRDGSWAVTEVQSIPIEWEGKRAILGFARDVTDRRQMEAQLIRSERLAALGTLLAGIAHEMNNPLAYVMLGVDQAIAELETVTSRPDGVTRQRELMTDVRQGVERVAAVVRQLRASSRPDPEQHGPVDLRQVAETALRVVRNETRHRAELVIDLAPVPPVAGSAHRLEQVLLNLLVNAIQALPEGRAGNELSVRLSHARAAAGADGAGQVVIEVADNGAGIPPDLVPRVFDPFFTTKPVGVGMGLGLSICHGIVTAHGGTIALESELGRGSTFRVSLPATGVAPAATAALASAAAGAGPAGDAAEAPARRQRRRLLVVDDEPALGEMIRRMLRDEMDVEVVTEARAALEALIPAASRPDLVLCDLMMPGMTGMDLFAAVADRLPGVERRFVFMTGGAFTPGASQFLATTRNVWLEKPFELATLRAALDRTARD